MARNQLPEGVGKKIVEALKRQAEADISPLEENDTAVNNTVPLSNIDKVEEIQFNSLLNETDNDNLIIEEEAPSLTINTPIKEEPKVVEPEIKPEPEKPTIKAQNTQFTELNTINVQQVKPKPVSSEIQVRIPANVAVLKRLIQSLPAGVSKQTGAQIIRQTLEAMGLPMSGVLKEAQEIQEELNISARESMIKIQEYRTNILQLEQTVQQYQQNINQINDLVSLFLLTDKK